MPSFMTCPQLRFSRWSKQLLIVCFALASVLLSSELTAQVINRKYKQEDKFRQLDELLPTPNVYRTAAGSPGHKYWQQRADYEIDVEIDDDKQRLIGSETITYYNNSPDTLTYIWMQLDANLFAPNSDGVLTETAPYMGDSMTFESLKGRLLRLSFQGQANITRVADAHGKPLKYRIVKTMMRIDLPKPLKPKEKFRFAVDWNFNINDGIVIGGRTGYEYFKKDKNYIYEMAQWFPRMVAYNDVSGWQHKQYLGRGEFTLEFGDYLVRITVPADHIVASTGVLKNSKSVLTKKQQKRYEKAKTAKNPVFIVTPKEAKQNEKSRAKKKKTWIFKAHNVRDFAFASSRKFIWDAQGHNVEGNPVMAMSFYPNEAEPLWSKYSTKAIIHAMNVYSRYTFKYPYPVSISVNGPVWGMEYPMITFNRPRPAEDGTYSSRDKYSLLTIIIHEVGHNYFPMIVNSDERQWTWMDEGLNTFLQCLTEREWEESYPTARFEPKRITSYMRSKNQVPIMTNSESVLQFGNNAYAKPAVALNILRETIMGRELFDIAFKEYAQRWKFKRPMPADFFRTMEDASAMDLDWFFRGWFYTTDHVDISIEDVKLYTISTGDPKIEKKFKKAKETKAQTITDIRNKPLPKFVDKHPELIDFYSKYDKYKVNQIDKNAYENYMKKLSPAEKKLLKLKKYFYVVDFKNIGGLVMPLIVEFTYADGKKERITIPAEIWKKNNEKVSKLFVMSKKVRSVELDPNLQTADTDVESNHFPRKIIESRFKLYKKAKKKNLMQKLRDAKKAAKKKKAKKD